DDGLWQAGHLRRHSRAPYLEPTGLCEDATSGGNRDGAPGEAAAPALDRLQRPARLLRSERLHAALSALLDLPGLLALPKGRSHQGPLTPSTRPTAREAAGVAGAWRGCGDRRWAPAPWASPILSVPGRSGG